MFKSPVYHSRIHKSPVYSSMPGIVAAGEVSTHALSFDGVDDCVDIASSIVPTGGSPKTVSLWFKCTGSISTRQWLFYAGAESGTGRFCLEIESGKFTSNWFSSSYSFSQALVSGSWYHAVASYDGSNVSVAVNGVVQSQVAALSTGATVTTRVGIFASGAFPFNGIIDDVRVYNRDLSAAEFLAMFVNATPAPTNGLVGHWKFDEGSGTTAADSSGNGNNGTLSGPTWTTDVPAQLQA